jgi:circadian clock protein KaiA
VIAATFSDAPPGQLLICTFCTSSQLDRPIHTSLNVSLNVRNNVLVCHNRLDFLATVSRHYQQIDCLVLQDDDQLPFVLAGLNNYARLLPTVILQSSPPALASTAYPAAYLFHSAEVRLNISDREAISPENLDRAIDQAMTAFLELSPACQMYAKPDRRDEYFDALLDDRGVAQPASQNVLLRQQRRLATKLKERLGDLGVYYKRHPEYFLRAMSASDATAFLDELKDAYQDIILGYFNEDEQINQKIDAFVDAAFFADLAVSQVVEIHMNLIGEFSKQLKLEGRSEEILSDYRLTLIDTLAHLCEMYRRSVPRENSPSL